MILKMEKISLLSSKLSSPEIKSISSSIREEKKYASFLENLQLIEISIGTFQLDLQNIVSLSPEISSKNLCGFLSID
jgi:hypothetical protein